MLGPIVGGGGLGRYVEELARELAQLQHKHRIVLFVKENGQKLGNRKQGTGISDQGTGEKIEYRVTNTHWYTLREQLLLPWKMDRERLDLILFPHWNVPLILRTHFVVTIHDLIMLEEPRSAKVTTRSPLIFALKRLGYKLVLQNALRRSRAIIAVSHYTKSSILKFFPWVPEDKIHVVYEGVTSLPSSLSPSPCSLFTVPCSLPPVPRSLSPHPYLLYVGNAYPHKNLEMLLVAFQKLLATHPTLSLILAGRGDIFYERLQKKICEMNIESRVHLILNPTDEQIADLYRYAALYVFPSRNEGFGLPPLEAMSMEVPVVCSRAASLPEILADAVLYFDPTNVQDMVEAIDKGLTDDQLRASLIGKGQEKIKRYSWKTMTKEILEILNQHAN